MAPKATAKAKAASAAHLARVDNIRQQRRAAQQELKDLRAELRKAILQSSCVQSPTCKCVGKSQNPCAHTFLATMPGRRIDGARVWSDEQRDWGSMISWK